MGPARRNMSYGPADTRQSGAYVQDVAWATADNRKSAVFLFNLPSHHYIYIVIEASFTRKDDQFENLGEITVLACEMLASGFRPWLKSIASLSSLVVDDGGNRTFSKIKPSKLDWDQLELRQWFQKILEVGEMGGVQQGDWSTSSGADE